MRILSKISCCFIPENLRKEAQLNVKARLFIVSTIFLSFLVGSLGLIYEFVLDDHTMAYDKYISSIFFLLVSLFSLQLTKSFKKSLTILCITGLLTIIFGTTQTGGIYSSTLFWLGIIPGTVYFFTDFRFSLKWFFATILIILFFFFESSYNWYSFTTGVESNGIYPLINILVVLVWGVFFALKNEESMRTIQRRLLQSNHELRMANRDKDNMMSVVAHDLKAPLVRIQGLAKLISLKGPLNNEQEGYIDLIEQVTIQGSSLIGDLLTLNNYNASLNFSEINLADFIEVEISKQQQTADKKGITIEVSGESSAKVETSTDHLSRVLDNLLSNALKFSKPGSLVQVGYKIMEKNYRIFVKDQGPGFTEDDKVHMYKMFRKLSANPTAGEHTSGIGLSIVKKFTDLLYGEIQLESTVGVGSTFYLTFPNRITRKSITSVKHQEPELI